MALPQLFHDVGALSPREIWNPYAIATTESTASVLRDLRTFLAGAAPGQATDLATFDDCLRQLVPDFSHLSGPDYDSTRSTRRPPIFDQQAFAPVLTAARNAETAGDPPLPLIVDVLECLPHDFPKNFHPQRDNGVAAKATVLVVKSIEAMFELLQVKAKYWVHDVFSICRAPALTEWKKRRGLAEDLSPTTAWIRASRDVGTPFFQALPKNHMRVGAVILSGGIASRFATQSGAGVALESDQVYSALLDSWCFTSYHHSLITSSSYPQLRSALLFRLCIVILRIVSTLPNLDPAFVAPPLSDIYDLFLYALSGTRFASFASAATAFGYDATSALDLSVPFARVSRYIKAFVRAHGTGRSGARTGDMMLRAPGERWPCGSYQLRKAAWAQARGQSTDNDEGFIKHEAAQSIERLRTLVWDLGLEPEVLELDDQQLRQWAITMTKQLSARSLQRKYDSEGGQNQALHPGAGLTRAPAAHGLHGSVGNKEVRQRVAWEITGKRGKPEEWHLTTLYARHGWRVTSTPAHLGGAKIYIPHRFKQDLPSDIRCAPLAIHNETGEAFIDGGRRVGNLYAWLSR